MAPAPSYVFVLILTLLDFVVHSQMSSNSKSHSFFRNNEDVRYLVENIPVAVPKDFPGSSGVRVQNVPEESFYSPKTNLKFYPPVLDFKERYLGIPHHEKVTIINTSRNKTVHMSSISGNTVHFHSSFFQDKVIPPLGNTSFNVVFLGRGEGDIESNLFIHTSEGSFKYQVRGESIGSPYRLRPLSGIRLPLNASYSPLILMHNPHATPLQLVEVYSSGGDFHLELPSGELEGPKHLWQIPAFLTKPVIRLRFHATTQKNHTAYIRLKVDKSGEALVVPVEVEVGPLCGLYSSDDLIDFGIGGSEDAPKQVNLYLRNSWKKPIRVQNVIATPVSKALKIDFQPVKVPPDDKRATQVAVLTLNWKLALETGQTSGRLIIKSTQGGHKLVMGYTATVLAGGLEFNKTETSFRTDQALIPLRPLSLTNNYKVPVAVTNATLSSTAATYFEIIHFSPEILMPGITRPLLTLKVKGSQLPIDLTLESTLKIYSNVSTLAIPLLCYNGKLIRIIPSDTNATELNLGTVGSGSINFAYIALVNKNPVEVKLSGWGTNLTGADVDLIAIEKGNISDATLAATLPFHNNITAKGHILFPGHFGIIQVTIPSGYELGHMHGHIWVATEYETITTSVNMRVEHGSLKVITDPVIFHNCFPSAVCSAEVRVESRFTVGMAVTGVSSVPYHNRLGFIPVSPPVIPPGGSTLLGHITWDMSGLEAYLSANSNSTGTHRWLDTLELPVHTRELDLSLLTTRYEHYLNMSAHLIELSLRLDTTEVRNLGFQAQIQPAWPSITQIPSRSVLFPLTQVGNVSYKYLTISNPASKYSIVVQLVLDPSYPLATGLINELPKSLRPTTCNVCCETTGQDTEDVFLVSVDGAGIVQSGVEPHRKSAAFLLAPSSSVSVVLAFQPKSAEYSSSILMVRNNLTVLETIQLSGTGAYAQFKFGNRKPGSASPLLFELAEKHLKDCEREKTRKHPAPNLTVKRSFTARNTGALPLTVLGFTINGQLCQGYGFRVLNCHAFHLPANSTKKIDIAFTPDFTLSRVSRVLTVLTSDSTANYTLVATLPPYLLATCSSVLGRPSWEPLLYYSAITFMLFLLLCVMAAAYFESNRILRNAIIAMSRENNVQPVLDLRLVGTEERINFAPQNSVSIKSESHCKALWNLNAQTDHDVRESSKSIEDNSTSFSNNIGSNKAQIGNSIGSGKKKCDKSICKRSCDLPEGTSDKSPWDCVLKRTGNSNQLAKPSKTSPICITTEPYTPLANMKTRDIGGVNKTDTQVKSRADPAQRLSEGQSRKNRKKNSNNNNLSCAEETRKKSVETVIVQRSIEEVETSSTTTESSSNDDGDREVESMFFRSVRHHLQNKAGRNRCGKINETPHTNNVPKKPLIEKGSSSSVDNEWEIEEDNSLERAIVVKNNRRPNLSRGRKQNCGNRVRIEQPQQQRMKQGGGERNNKPSGRKDKAPAVKKRADKCERHTPVTKVTGAVVTSREEISPSLPPSTPVWTASFSDVVARSDSTYSSVVALKNHHHQQQTNFKQGSTPSVEPIGPKRPANNVWSNWSTYTEPASSSSQPQTSSTTNSLFTDSSTTLQPAYESVWADQNVMKILQDQRVIDPQQYEPQQTYTVNNDWPLMTSLWGPLYTPSVESLPPVWGSEVWAPPTRRSPTPPPETQTIQHNMEYDPFRSLSNIWAQHSPNIWKPPKSD